MQHKNILAFLFLTNLGNIYGSEQIQFNNALLTGIDKAQTYFFKSYEQLEKNTFNISKQLKSLDNLANLHRSIDQLKTLDREVKSLFEKESIEFMNAIINYAQKIQLIMIAKNF